ncbi:MAG: hemolysin family protein [Fibromonadales bacterium]|nr:hemolysin family protein [Fibromonadales bacterium]
MDPDSTTIHVLIFASSVALLLLAFVHSLISKVFGCIHLRRSADLSEVYEEIESIMEKREFREIVFQGTFFPSFIAATLLGLEFAASWYLWFAIFVGIYFFIFFLTEILATIFSDTLSKFCIKTYNALYYIFLLSAKISIFFQDCILSISGYDSRLSFLTESMRKAVNDEKGEDALEEEEKQMIKNIFAFGDTPVRKIMTPRVEMHAVDAQTPLPDVIKLLNGERYSRLPIYSGSIDNIIGILSNKSFLEWYSEKPHDSFDLEKLAKPAIFVPAGKKIDALLHELREGNSHLAIVIDEYGGTAGLVTMEDILEEIVGEIRDEDDSKEEDMGIVKLSTGQYLLDPLINLSDLENRLGLHFTIEEDEHIDTLSGLIQHVLGTLPETGTTVKIDGYSFKVSKMDGTKMEEVILETLP